MGSWNGRGLAVFSLVAAAGLLYSLARLTVRPVAQPPDASGTRAELLVYCAAGIKPAIEEAAAAFEREPFGVPVRLQYGGSGTLLNNLQIAKRGDIFIPADESYLDLARRHGIVADTFVLAAMRPALVVARGNPLGIRGLRDLTRADVRVGLASPEATSIGKLTRDLLEAEGLWARVEANLDVSKPTVSDVANDVMIGTIDVTVVWDAMAAQHANRLDCVSVPVFDRAVQQVSLGVLRGSTQPAIAVRFAHYLQSPDQGQPCFIRHHYGPAPCDPPSLRPAGAIPAKT